MKNVDQIRQLLEKARILCCHTCLGGKLEEQCVACILNQALTLFDEPFTIKNADVPEGFLLIKADSFLDKLNKITFC